MSAGRLLVLWSVWVVARAGLGEANSVRQEVEKIFKSVEEFMSGQSPALKRNFKQTQTQNVGASESRFRVKDSEVNQEIETESPLSKFVSGEKLNNVKKIDSKVKQKVSVERSGQKSVSGDRPRRYKVKTPNFDHEVASEFPVPIAISGKGPNRQVKNLEAGQIPPAELQVSRSISGDRSSKYKDTDTYIGQEKNPTGLPVSRSTSDDRPFSPSFPVGVILSDNLYPLVVGKNVESGKPFVMNFDKQHALVVARAGGEDYRLMIPFPVILGESPAYKIDDRLRQEYHGNHPPGRARKHRLRNAYYNSHPKNTPKKYSQINQSYRNYQKEIPVPLEDDDISAAEQHKKDAQNYHFHRNQQGEGPSQVDEPNYNSYPPNETKKYPQNQNYRNHYRSELRNHPVNENYKTYHTEVPHSNIRLQNYAPLNPARKDIFYQVEGPKYNNAYPLKSYVPQAYRNSQYHLASQNYHPYPLEIPTSKSPNPNGNYYVEQQSVHELHPPKQYEANVYRAFRPSPYIGNISADNVNSLRSQSQVYESNDERGAEDEFTEQDYVDSIRDSPEAHSSSGEVRHVTYHVDDYLGKIYEEMYYRLPSPPPSGSQAVDSQKEGTQVFPSLRYEGEVTTYSQNTTEAVDQSSVPVSFQKVAAKTLLNTGH